ncbi:MAG: TRAP transporter small permease [Acuticoccus sp.]
MAVAALLLVAIVGLVGVASVARTAGAPIIWSIEVAQLLFVWLVMLAADIALQQGRHFGLSLLLDNLPPRARRAFDVLNILILIVLLAFLSRYAVKNVMLMHPRLIGATQMNASLVHGALLFGIVLFLRTLLVQLYRRVSGRSEAA